MGIKFVFPQDTHVGLQIMCKCACEMQIHVPGTCTLYKPCTRYNVLCWYYRAFLLWQKIQDLAWRHKNRLCYLNVLMHIACTHTSQLAVPIIPLQYRVHILEQRTGRRTRVKTGRVNKNTHLFRACWLVDDFVSEAIGQMNIKMFEM
jgi:hypothetical protein